MIVFVFCLKNALLYSVALINPSMQPAPLLPAPHGLGD